MAAILCWLQCIKVIIMKFTEASMHHKGKCVYSLWPSDGHIASHTVVNIGSGNCLSPVQHPAITLTNAELLLIRHLGANLKES